MVKLAVLNDLNLFDSIQVQINESGGVSQEQRSILENQPSFLAGVLKRIWSNISYLGVLLIGLVLLIAFEADGISMGVFTLFMLAVSIGISVVYELPYQKKRVQIQNDLAASRVKKENGTIVFFQEALHADIRERLLILPRANNGLLPGNLYRFFYLDESGIVVSAEKLESPGEEVEKQRYQEILTQANQFHPEALTSNRQGRLMPSQQLKQFGADMITGGMVIIGFAAVSAYFFNIYRTSLASAEGGSTLPLICGGTSLLIGLVGLITFGRSFIDLLRGKVLVVSGVGRKAARIARRRTLLGKTQEENPIAYYYEIGEKLFKVKEPAANVFFNDIRYNAYYTSLSKTLVGIEPVESPARGARPN